MKAKTCTRCEVRQPLTAFPQQAGRSDGRHSWCRCCMNEARRKVNLSASQRRQRAAYGRAVQRALQALRRRHPDEYAKLFAEARRGVGL